MITEFLILLATIGLALYIYSKFFGKLERDYWVSKGVPYLTTEWSFWEVLTRKRRFFEQNYYQQLKTLGQKFGCVKEFGGPTIFIADPDLIKNIFVKDFESFMDRRSGLEHDTFASKMLTMLKGQEWKDVRGFLTPTFTSGKIRRMFGQFSKSSKELLKLVEREGKKCSGGFLVKVPDIARRFTMDVIGGSAFGIETNALKDGNSEFYKYALRLSEPPKRQMVNMAISTFLPRVAECLKISTFELKVVEYFKGILFKVFKAREEEGRKWDDFLQLILEAKKGKLDLELEEEVGEGESDITVGVGKAETGRRKVEMSEEMIMAQSFMFFFAGFDTVSGLVSLVLYVLAVNEEIQEKVFKEVEKGIEEGGDGVVNYEAVSRMDYLDMFISEVLRRYTSLPRLERKCTEEYKVPGTDVVIPKGMILMIDPEAIHMDPEYYPEPEVFRPERFTKEEKAERNPYVYMPFGIGPRNCIGMRFGLIETKVAVANLLHNFIIKPTENTPNPVKLERFFGVAQRTPQNLQLNFIPRN